MSMRIFGLLTLGVTSTAPSGLLAASGLAEIGKQDAVAGPKRAPASEQIAVQRLGIEIGWRYARRPHGGARLESRF